MNKQQLRENLAIETKTSKKERFLKNQNECYLCGSDINTYLEYIPLTYFAVEKAQCHNCMTLIRVKNHSIQ